MVKISDRNPNVANSPWLPAGQELLASVIAISISLLITTVSVILRVCGTGASSLCNCHLH